MSCDVETGTVSSIESCAPAAQLVRRTREIEVTAVRAPTTTPLASFNFHLTGYARPATPTFTAGGLSIGAKKPSNA